MASLVDGVLAAADIGGCLGIDASIFPAEPGFSPLIKGFVGASLGPYEPLLALLDPDTIIPTVPTKLLEFPLELQKLIDPTKLIPELIIAPFNVNAKGLPTIPINIPPIGEISVGDGPELDTSQVQALIDFVTGLIMIPINFIKDLIIIPLISLEIPAPTLPAIKDLLEASLGAIPFPPGLPSKFAECLLKVFVGVVNLFLQLFKLPGLPI